MRGRWTSSAHIQWSLWSVIVCWVILFFFRFHPIHDKPISWDALGYYLPLAFTCIHHDPLLTDKAWLEERNARDDLTGTLYQITISPEGKDMYFFLFGWSYCYAPFFGIGHLAAIAFAYPADGFSWPYQLALTAGGLIYLAIGLFFWRKILRTYFDDRTTAITIFCIVIGTNFVNHLSIDNLSTVNLLFMWMAVLIWNTSAWYRTGKGKHLVGILFSWGIMTLIKPSETLVCLIPLLWKAEWNMPVTWLSAFRHAFRTPKYLVIGIGCVLLLLTPQVTYWYTMTGQLLFDSYQNAGVGLDWLHTHFMDVLFSYRKGWFVYTPIMMFACIGWVWFRRSNPMEGSALMWSFLVFFYVVASWTEWWYGGGFSQRTLIPSYVILSLGFAAFVRFVFNRAIWIRMAMALLCLLLIGLNQFQWWQFKKGILDPYRTTERYFKAVWLKTAAPPNGDLLKLVQRNFNDELTFDSTHYRLKTILYPTPQMQMHSAISREEWAFDMNIPFNELTDLDHLWLMIDAELEWGSYAADMPLLVFYVKHNGVYGYRAVPFQRNDSSSFSAKSFIYLTPELRDHRDVIGTHIWNRSKVPFKVKQWQLKVYEPIE